LPRHIYSALLCSKKHNEEQHEGFVLTEEGGHVGSIALSKTLDTFQFVLGCTGCGSGKQHYKFATLNSIRNDKAKLECWVCVGKTSSSSSNMKDSKFQSEVDVAQQLQSRGLDQQTAPQVAVEWWNGRVDFYHFSSKTCINVDGTAHFSTFRGKRFSVALERDLTCCSRAWEGGGRLVRVHAEDAECCAWLLQQAVETAGKPLIVLSPGFDGVRWQQGSVKLQYLAVLKARLGRGVHINEHTDGSVWLTKE
jgi:hypothetical protein